MTFRPPRRQGLLIGLALLIALLALDAVWLSLLTRLANPSLAVLWIALILASLPALAFVANSLIGLARLAYVLDRDALTIRWGFSSVVIPLSEIGDVLISEEIDPEAYALLHLRGLYWPGRFVGPGRAETFGPAHFYATRPWPDRVLVIRGNSVYVLSPTDANAFQAAFAQARAQTPGEDVTVTAKPPALTSRLRDALRRSQHDRVAQALIAAGVALNAFLFVYLAWLYPRLPEAVPLHFDQNGTPDIFGPPSQTFILPIIGLIVLLMNSLLGWGLHARWARSPAYLLWGATIVVQVMLWAAAFGLSPGF